MRHMLQVDWVSYVNAFYGTEHGRVMITRKRKKGKKKKKGGGSTITKYID